MSGRLPAPMFFVLGLALVLLLLPLVALSAPKKKQRIETNAAYIYNAPDWLKRNRAEKSIRRIQRDLEWSIRRVPVYFYKDVDSFTKAHNLGPFVTAVTVSNSGGSTVHLGPKVTNDNFDQVFSHELVHVIIYQKYKDAIPKWLEEGLANHLAKKKKVDYKWLASKTLPEDVTKALVHPLNTKSFDDAVFRYKASQALAEMLSKKCDLRILLQLSVERKMENYIKTYCEIKDLNATFKEWVAKKAK